jgi:hypothetical protein
LVEHYCSACCPLLLSYHEAATIKSKRIVYFFD